MFGNLLDRADFTPHGYCLSWRPDLLALHVVSDAMIGLAYFSIPLALTVFVVRRADLAFRGLFWLFVTFIMACGSTHLMSIWTIWHPDYAAEGVVKAVTAGASVLTAVLLWQMLPGALALPSPAALRDVNERLRVQVREREAAVAELQRERADRQRAEDMLRHSQKMEAIGQLTGGVAHDFNNMLTVVMANLELLAKHVASDSPLRKYVDRATRGASRGATVTQQLLAFARRQPLRPIAFDVAERVVGLGELLHGIVGRAISLEFALPEGLWQVEADPNQLENALLNLVLNARDAMKGGGQVTIAAVNSPLNAIDLGDEGELAGEFVAISVADTGTGMPPDVRRAAFDPFFTTKVVGEGSGLGLSQVYGFARQSRGHVTLQSAPGEGTTVTLYLRRAACTPQAQPDPAPAARAITFG